VHQLAFEGISGVKWYDSSEVSETNGFICQLERFLRLGPGWLNWSTFQAGNSGGKLMWCRGQMAQSAARTKCLGSGLTVRFGECPLSLLSVVDISVP
jgi:hypothetical protein